jgi:hypothetical protein
MQKYTQGRWRPLGSIHRHCQKRNFLLISVFIPPWRKTRERNIMTHFPGIRNVYWNMYRKSLCICMLSKSTLFSKFKKFGFSSVWVNKLRSHTFSLVNTKLCRELNLNICRYVHMYIAVAVLQMYLCAMIEISWLDQVGKISLYWVAFWTGLMKYIQVHPFITLAMHGYTGLLVSIAGRVHDEGRSIGDV